MSGTTFVYLTKWVAFSQTLRQFISRFLAFSEQFSSERENISNFGTASGLFRATTELF